MMSHLLPADYGNNDYAMSSSHSSSHNFDVAKKQTTQPDVGNIPVHIQLHISGNVILEHSLELLMKNVRNTLINNRRREEAWENFGKPNRDVRSFRAVLTEFTYHNNWSDHLVFQRLQQHWLEILNNQTMASAVTVVSVRDGVVYISVVNEVYAQTIFGMKQMLIEAINNFLQDYKISDIVIPNVKIQPTKNGIRYRVNREKRRRMPQKWG